MTAKQSHPARGAWIEIIINYTLSSISDKSHPARGAWIEIQVSPPEPPLAGSRTPQGVRGLKC